MIADFSPREFLRGRNAVLVHFSTVRTVGKSQPDLVFPQDLINASGLQDQELSFSTILRGDSNSRMKDGRGGAEGCVGILVDIGPSADVRSVLHCDSGAGRFGLEPTEENCAASIDKRTTSNEWRVLNYVPVGMFVLPPIYVISVMNVGGLPIARDIKVSLAEAIAPFPKYRIFSANDHSFLQLDRASSEWREVDYDSMIPGVGSQHIADRPIVVTNGRNSSIN
jgi:hypothetical protein